MKTKLAALISLSFSGVAMAGSLYTFDPAIVQVNALNWIQSRDSYFAKQELIFENMDVGFDKNTKKLVATVFYKYKSNSRLGFSYVCATVNENGELERYKRDIPAQEKLFNMTGVRPSLNYCPIEK